MGKHTADYAHYSKSTQAWKAKHLPKNLKFMKRGQWPARSPDLNLIERLWAILDARIVQDEPKTREELIKCIRDEWWKISSETIIGLYDGMFMRCSDCIKAAGDRFLH